MSKTKIDLNADLGERIEGYAIDTELMKHISSANIACGGHAGDKESVRRMVELATSLGVAVGAHPSFPDRANFGRIAMNIEPAILQRSLGEQIGLVAGIAARLGTRLRHIKAHGALYHSANSDVAVAQAISNAVHAVDPSVIVIVQCNSPAGECYQKAGLRVATEAFADRAYEPTGELRSRMLQGALLDENHAVRQALRIVLEHKVIASDGSELPIRPDTLCFHSDTPDATSIAKQVREALENAGVQIAPL